MGLKRSHIHHLGHQRIVRVPVNDQENDHHVETNEETVQDHEREIIVIEAETETDIMTIVIMMIATEKRIVTEIIGQDIRLQD